MYASLINLPPMYTPISAFPPPADFRTKMCSLSELLFCATITYHSVANKDHLEFIFSKRQLTNPCNSKRLFPHQSTTGSPRKHFRAQHLRCGHYVWHKSILENSSFWYDTVAMIQLFGTLPFYDHLKTIWDNLQRTSVQRSPLPFSWPKTAICSFIFTIKEDYK